MNNATSDGAKSKEEAVEIAVIKCDDRAQGSRYY